MNNNNQITRTSNTWSPLKVPTARPVTLTFRSEDGTTVTTTTDSIQATSVACMYLMQGYELVKEGANNA